MEEVCKPQGTTLKNKLPLVNKIMCLVKSISSTKTTCLAKAWTITDRLSNKIKQDFLQALVMSILEYRCITSTLTKCIEKKKQMRTAQECYETL